MDLLLFRLYGPLASWGEIAVGESRHSANYPSKSAILGLVGAALGIERSDEAQQAGLQQGYQVAVEVFSTGQLLRDYHTAQVPDSAGKFVYRTRRDGRLHFAWRKSKKSCASRCFICIWGVSPARWRRR